MRHTQGVRFALVAVASATLFEALKIPLGAMIGPMLAVALYAHWQGVSQSPGTRAHDAAILLIGLALGGQVTPNVFAQITLWPISLLILVCTMTLILGLGGLINRRLLALDPISAHMAAAPGNLSTALAVTEHSGGALSQVAVYQSLRLAFLTLMVPFFFVVPDTEAPPPAFTETDALLWLGLMSLGWVLTLGLRQLNVTTPGLIAGVAVGGSVSVSEWAVIQTPDLFIAFAMMLFGWRIGVDIVRQGLKVLIKTLPPAALSTLFAVGCALLGAYLAHRILGFPLIDTVLGFMPGAFQVMPVVALEAGADALYVTTHHLIRVLAMGLIIPLSVTLWKRT